MFRSDVVLPSLLPHIADSERLGSYVPTFKICKDRDFVHCFVTTVLPEPRMYLEHFGPRHALKTYICGIHSLIKDDLTGPSFARICSFICCIIASSGRIVDICCITDNSRRYSLLFPPSLQGE